MGLYDVYKSHIIKRVKSSLAFGEVCSGWWFTIRSKYLVNVCLLRLYIVVVTPFRKRCNDLYIPTGFAESSRLRWHTNYGLKIFVKLLFSFVYFLFDNDSAMMLRAATLVSIIWSRFTIANKRYSPISVLQHQNKPHFLHGIWPRFSREL